MRTLCALLLALAVVRCSSVADQASPTLLSLDGHARPAEARFQTEAAGDPPRTYVQVLDRRAGSLRITLPGDTPEGSYFIHSDVSARRARVDLLMMDGVTYYAAEQARVQVQRRGDRLGGSVEAVLVGRDGRRLRVSSRFEAVRAPFIMIEG